MAMSLEDWNKLAQSIVENRGDQAQITTLVTQATEAYAGAFGEAAQATSDNERLTQENSNLVKANMQLFLERGASLTAGPSAEPTKPKESSRAETITISDLFKKEK